MLSPRWFMKPEKCRGMMMADSGWWVMTKKRVRTAWGFKGSPFGPNCFPLDLMHLTCLNLPPLLLDLWCGQIELNYDRSDKPAWIVLDHDEDWKEHGQLVESMTRYIPGFFGRTPRNPAKKINSGYKACEYLLYIWALGPALFRLVLPPAYWRNYCKLVRAVRIVPKRWMSSEDIEIAHRLLLEWENEYEIMYYDRQIDRLHLVRPFTPSLMLPWRQHGVDH